MSYKKLKDYINIAVLLTIIFLFIEVVFFNSGIIFSLLVASGLIYFGRKQMPSLFGKLLFWAGVFFFGISVMNMMTVKFFLLAILIYLLLEYYQKKKAPEKIQPIIKEPTSKENGQEPLVKKKPLLENIFIGERKTPDHAYEWSDVNILTGIGDTVIDLSYTVIPRGETIIFIRKMIGNVVILIPYDVEVSVNHSVITGNTTIFENKEEKVFNQCIITHTEGYDMAKQKVKIITSLLVGNLEVKRV